MSSPAAASEAGVYLTRDIHVAVYLLARGAQLPAVGGRRSRCLFTFADPDGAFEWMAQGFGIASEDMVSAGGLFSALNRLKRALDQAFGGRPGYTQKFGGTIR